MMNKNHEQILVPKRARLLVVGAGVLGTFYAARLALAGHEVTILERSEERLSQIREKGLLLEDATKGKRESVRVSVIERIDPEESYDLALIIVRKTHLDSVLATLAPTTIPTLLFMVSNALGPQAMIDGVGEKRVVVGFPGAGGIRHGEIVRWVVPPKLMQPTQIGEVNGEVTPRIRSIARLLDSAGFPTAIASNMDAWLKSHETLVATLAAATYAANGNGHQLAHDRKIMRLCLQGIREGFSVLDALQIPVTPWFFRFFQIFPIAFIRWTFGRFLDSQAWELGTAQINAMRDEMELMTEELAELAKSVNLATPARDELVRIIKTDNKS